MGWISTNINGEQLEELWLWQTEIVKPYTSVIVYDLARLACGLSQVHVECIECCNHVRTTNQEFTPILLNLALRVVGCL